MASLANAWTFLVKRVTDFVDEVRTQIVSRYFWKDTLVVALGILVYMIGFSFFIYPQRITTGGLSGFCNLITIATGLPISIPYNLINISLFVIAFFFLNGNFLIKTLLGVMMLGLSISFFTDIAVPDPSKEELFKLMILADQPVVALILGSLLIGLGLGLVFSVNGSTGGTDIVVAIIRKYKNMSFGRIFMLVDGAIVVSSYFVNVYLAIIPIEPIAALEKLIYSIIQVFLVSITLDWYIRSNRLSVQIMVFSRKYAEINDAIVKRLQRGCTILEGKGGYTGEPAKVLVIITRQRQSVAVTRLIEEIDPEAFVTLGEVRGVYGRGFEAIGQK